MRKGMAGLSLWVACSLAGCRAAACAAQQSGTPAGVSVQAATHLPERMPSAVPVETQPAVFRIRVVDGRNGQPLENARVRFWYDESGNGGYSLATAANGTVPMPEPVGTPVRVLLAPEDHMDCRKAPVGEALPGYNLLQIAARGIVMPNTCGPVSAKPLPGELVFFVRPLRWYEHINRP